MLKNGCEWAKKIKVISYSKPFRHFSKLKPKFQRRKKISKAKCKDI